MYQKTRECSTPYGVTDLVAACPMSSRAGDSKQHLFCTPLVEHPQGATAVLSRASNRRVREAREKGWALPPSTGPPILGIAGGSSTTGPGTSKALRAAP